MRWLEIPIKLGTMLHLTRQEQMVLCVVLGLLLTGWAVRNYRLAHPPPAAGEAVTRP